MDRKCFCAATAAALAASVVRGPLALAETLPPQDEYAVLSRLGSLMEGVWPRGNFPNAEGATGANTSGYVQVGFQWTAFSLVPNAILLKNKRTMDAVLRIAEYAFAHQHADGRFDYSETNGTVTTGSVQGPLGEASTAANFLSDFGHTLLILPKSPWFSTAPECAGFRARLEALRTKVVPSLDWLLTQRDVLATDRAASNRTITHAHAFYFNGRALGRSDAMDAGRQIFQGALARQTPDGIFPEAGGFDSSYQTANILETEWMYLNLDPVDDHLRAPAWDAIKRGVARELPSVQSNGDVSTAGNTRVRDNGESYLGHHKSVNSKQVMACLAYYGVMAGDDAALATARRVYTHFFPNDKVDF